MKATFFNKPLEWNVETQEESWQQGAVVNGLLKVKNHGTEKVSLASTGVGLAFADLKKVHAKTEGVLRPEVVANLPDADLGPGAQTELTFSLKLPPNSPVSDKKASYFLTYGRNVCENHLQLKVEPKLLYTKLVGLLDTFHRFKVKEYKASKVGVEYKLIPPSARDMANLESLSLSFSMEDSALELTFEFLVKKLDTSSVVNKINKEAVKIHRLLTPKEYSLGKDMINQDQLLKVFEGVLSEVKMKAVF